MDRVDLGIAQRLKKVREFKKLSQSQLAKLLGVSQKAISQWERGERAIPATILKQLQEHLNLNPLWLLTGEGEPFVTPQGEGVKKKTLQVV